MRKNKIISISISLILILTLLLGLATTPVLAQADYFFIGDFSDYGITTGCSSSNMVVDSSGNYWIIVFNDTTPYDFVFYYSDDSGDTWSSEVEFDMSSDSNEQPDYVAICINDDDIIHIAYSFGWVDPTPNTMYNISYRSYNTITDTISSKTHIVMGTDYNFDYTVYGLSISVNDEGEICIFYSVTRGTYNTFLYCRVYNDQAEIWGDINELNSIGTGGASRYVGLSSDVLSNGTFVVSYIYYLNSNYNRFRIRYYDDETDDTAVYYSYTNDDSSSGDNTDIAIDSNDNISCVYEKNGAVLNYTYYDTVTTNSGEESLVESSASKLPQLAINSDGTIQIVFIGDNGVTPSDWVMGYYGSFGSWSALQYYQSGATDNMISVKIPYQNLQSFTHLSDGVVGYFVNGSSNYAYHFDEGYELFGGGGSGQNEGSVGDSDYSRCSAGSGSNINIYAPYIESFVTSFGDVTIGAVDLFVSVDQYNTVNNDKSKYFAYLNGVSIGNPDYFFQESSTEYVLRWLFSGIDIGFYNVVLEFGMTGSSGAPYGMQWMNLPTNIYNIQGSTYHDNASDFGDGIRQGYYFSTSNYDLGTKYCLYYNLNAPVDSNTYDLTLFSVDPHLQGNTTSISVDVTGSNDWWAILRSPSDSVIFFETHFGGDNGDAVYRHTFSPDAEIGEWKFYALDRGYYSYPFGGLDDYGTNISLNVSDGSASFGDWEVFPYEAIVPLNTWTGFSVIAPLGNEFTVRVYRPSESSYEDYVGIGEGSTLIYSGPFIDCDTEGTWTLMLFNTTGSVSYNMDIKQFVVDSGTLQNSLTILGPNDICIGGYVTFEGNYLDSIGSIEVILDYEHSYSIGLSLGSFIKHFTIPMDAEGDWTAYLADSSGNIISGTTVSFTSINCDAEVPPDDEDTDDDASAWADEIVPNEFNPYVGAIIVGIFMCIPFGLSAQTGMEFPMIGYGFFGMLGLGLSTSLGFFDTWIIYTLVVTIIGVAVIVIFIKR